MLAQAELPALHYRFNVPIAQDALPPYSWHYAPWTKCSAQCAGGEARVWARDLLGSHPELLLAGQD